MDHRLAYYLFLMLFVGQADVSVRMSVSECVSLSRLFSPWRDCSQVSTLTDADNCTHIRHTLRSSDVLPVGRLITSGRGGTAGSKGAMEGRSAQH